MRCAERYDEAVLEREGNIEAHECARSLAQVADVVLSVRHVVLDDHVPVPNPVVLVLLYHEVVVHVALRRGF